VRSASDSTVGACAVWPSGAFGRCAGWAVLFIEAGPMNLLFNISSFSNYSHWSQLVKYEKVTSRTPKISKLCMLEDGLKRNKFPFGKKSKFPT
jgi:hypothetical protein